MKFIYNSADWIVFWFPKDSKTFAYYFMANKIILLSYAKLYMSEVEL